MNNTANSVQSTPDLLHDDYFTLQWPTGKIHSERFPYLVVRVASGVYSPIGIPGDLGSNVETLIKWARDFAGEFGYGCCLVLERAKCFYIKPNGDIQHSDEVTSGGSIINWKKYQDGLIKCVEEGT